MKRLLFSLVLSTASLLVCKAVPANPSVARVLQPDGSYITLVLHGDEFLNFQTTADGYSVVKGADGYWRYAVKSGDVLAASGVNAEISCARSQCFG